MIIPEYHMSKQDIKINHNLNLYKKKYKFYKNKYLQKGFGVNVQRLDGETIYCNLDFSQRQNILSLKNYLFSKYGYYIDDMELLNLKSGELMDDKETILDNENFSLFLSNPFNVEITSFYFTLRGDEFESTKKYYPNSKNTKISEIKDELSKKIKIKNKDFGLYKLNENEEKLEMLKTDTKLKSIFGEEDQLDDIKKLEVFVIPIKTIIPKQKYKEKTILFYLRDKSISKDIILQAISDIEMRLIKKVEIKKLFNIKVPVSLGERFSNDDLGNVLLDELRELSLQTRTAENEIQMNNSRRGEEGFKMLYRKQTLINIDYNGILNLPNNNYKRCQKCSDFVCNLRIDMNPKQGNKLSIEQVFRFLNKKRDSFTDDEIQILRHGINLTDLMHIYGKFINRDGWSYMTMTIFTQNLLNGNYSQWNNILREYPDFIELSIILIKLKWLTTDILDSTEIPLSTKNKIKELFTHDPDFLRESLILPVSQLIQYLPNISYNLPEKLREPVRIICSNNRYYNYAINYAINHYLKKI